MFTKFETELNKDTGHTAIYALKTGLSMKGYHVGTIFEKEDARLIVELLNEYYEKQGLKYRIKQKRGG